MAAEGRRRVSRADIESKVRELTGQVEGEVRQRQGALVPALAAASVAVVLLAYLFGRRAGRRRSAVVEIRRA